jgi:acyl-CoA hydrolase
MPRTHGHTAVPLGRLTTFRIGDLVAGLVEDGACLQLGIGANPEAVLARLRGKRDLGIHTEFSFRGFTIAPRGRSFRA